MRVRRADEGRGVVILATLAFPTLNLLGVDVSEVVAADAEYRIGTPCDDRLLPYRGALIQQWRSAGLRILLFAPHVGVESRDDRHKSGGHDHDPDKEARRMTQP